MTIEQLTEIISTADTKVIHKQLLALGYVYCNKDKTLGKLNIVDLFNGDEQQSKDIIDSAYKFVYDGCITHNVKCYEKYEFIAITVCKIRPSTDPFDDDEIVIQTEMHIYAKEI
ncbi:MAG: hypothetical protein K2F90_01920 [Clostridiales bacterium]|nr:hypothetical protein [Clostridiales bacterium]